MERIVNIGERRIQTLQLEISALRAEIAERELEIQRIQRGNQPQDLTDPKGRDRFWKPMVDYNQTRAEQANMQSDAKQMAVQPPYRSLLQ